VKEMKPLSLIKNAYLFANRTVLLVTVAISTIVPVFVAWWFYPLIFDQISKYTDLIAGTTTWDGYFKRGDITLFYVYFATFCILLITVPLVLNRLVKIKSNESGKLSKILSHPLFYLTAAVLFGLAILTRYRIYLFVLSLVFIVCLYLVLRGHKSFSKSYARFCLLGIFGYFSIIALSVLSATIFGFSEVGGIYNSTQNYIWTALATAVLAVAFAFKRDKINELTINKLLLISQIFLPALFIAFYQFRYYHQGVELIQFHSDRLMYLCWIVAIGMILYNVFEYWRSFFRKEISGNDINISDEQHDGYENQNRAILITTTISVPAFVMLSMPIGYLLVDFFHNGEHTVAMQQFIQFGAVPFIDYYPIHGLFNYAHGFFNYVFFGGEYSTFSASSMIMSITGCIILSVLLRRFTGGEVFPFLLSLIIANAGGDSVSRWFGVSIMILILHNRSFRENPFKFLWWWIATSIIAIAWNTPLGGVAAISFIPLLFFSFMDKKGCISELLKRELSCRKSLIAWIVLIMIGLAFIPMFANIILVLVANLGATIEANGNSLTDAILSHSEGLIGNRYLNIFMALVQRPLGFVFVVALLLMIRFESKEKNNMDVGAILQILIFTLLIAGYTFVRVEPTYLRIMLGNRALFIAISGALGGYLIKNHAAYRSVLFIPLLLALAIGGGTIGLFLHNDKFFAPPSIQPEFIEFSGEAAGIENLGTVYSPQYYTELLADTSYVVSDLDVYLDWTDNVAFHSIFAKRSPVPTSSIYNTQTRLLHYRYIESLKDEPPELILVYPATTFDGRSVAFRAYPVWRWVMMNGYEPYNHNDVIFLLSENSSKRYDFECARDMFIERFHIKNLGFLPISWGSEEIISNVLTQNDVILNEIGSNQIENGMILGEDSFIIYQFDSPVLGIDNDFLVVNINSDHDLLLESDFQVFWAYENGEFTEEMSFSFRGDSGVMVIPLGSSPSWIFAEELTYLRFHFPDSMSGKTMPQVELSQYVYNDYR